VLQATLALVVVLAAALRFYGLSWGAPYFHFHIDEHFVFIGAEQLRISMKAAAESGKFFMYGPLPMHLLNGVVWVYEGIKGPLVLTRFQDQITYMVMGRAISALMGTACGASTSLANGSQPDRRPAGRRPALAATVVHRRIPQLQWTSR
jgi:hypothetical protein